MLRGMGRLSRSAQAELQDCIQKGLTAHQTRLRLTIHGVAMSDRAVTRHMAKLRGEERRVRELEAIGRGLGSVQIGATGAAEILRASAPDWRRKQSGILQDLFQRFLEHPSGELYSGLAVGLHSFLLSTTLSEALERSDG